MPQIPVYSGGPTDVAQSLIGHTAASAALVLSGAGPPTSGVAGTGAGQSPFAYQDTTNNVTYLNIGTSASPTWAPGILGESV